MERPGIGGRARQAGSEEGRPESLVGTLCQSEWHGPSVRSEFLPRHVLRGGQVGPSPVFGGRSVGRSHELAEVRASPAHYPSDLYNRVTQTNLVATTAMV